MIYPLQMRMLGFLVASNKVEPTQSCFEFFPSVQSVLSHTCPQEEHTIETRAMYRHRSENGTAPSNRHRSESGLSNRPHLGVSTLKTAHILNEYSYSLREWKEYQYSPIY